jgi:peptide/nickel transport system ATP-binding protein
VTMAFLEITDLNLFMDGYSGANHVLRGVNLTVEKGQIWGLVGETGSGKSLTAQSVARLVPSPPARYTSGSIRLEGQELMTTDEAEMRTLRGSRIGMIFQDPTTYLNPAFRIGTQLVDVALNVARYDPASLGQKVGFGLSWRRKAAHRLAIDMLAKVGIRDPERRIRDYPHQFSGGQKQRILIAMALIGRPSLLIADEPTTALDVSIQAQILRLIWTIVAEEHLTVLFISHNLGVVAQICSHVAVMNAGAIVEQGTVEEIFDAPRHDYTRRLLAAVPSGRSTGRRTKAPEVAADA